MKSIKEVIKELRKYKEIKIGEEEQEDFIDSNYIMHLRGDRIELKDGYVDYIISSRKFSKSCIKVRMNNYEEKEVYKGYYDMHTLERILKVIEG